MNDGIASCPIVVTGAASGIGAAVADALRAQGRAVIGLDRSPGDGIVVCDLAQPAAIADIVGGLPHQLGGLANVAGLPGTAAAAAVLAVNVLAPRLLAESLSERLAPGSAIVNVASVAAHRNTQPPQALATLMGASSLADLQAWLTDHPIDGAAAYDTSKRVLVDWTPLLAARLLGSGVRCLSVSPGPVHTPILADFVASMGQESMDRSVAAVGRHGRPEEIAAVIAFALSPGASWLNGIDIPVEGGLFAARLAAAARNPRRNEAMNDTVDHAQVIILDGTLPGDREVLGGKAYSVNRMRSLGLPVPAAFALPTSVCARYHGNSRSLPEDVWLQVLDAVHDLEEQTGRSFGAGPSPLLVSVRSGAAQSMPGMMDTVLNLGLTPALVDVLAAESGDPAWAADTWRRLCRSYAEIVLGVEPTAATPPCDAFEQLRAAIGAVFDSWTNERVRAYRERHHLGAGGGTAVTVQAMVFGNRDDQSATGVMFSRNPNTGARELYGEWLTNAQGEEVVSGETTPRQLSSLRAEFPTLYAEAETVAATLEAENRDMVDIEFTIESGRLYMLQCRTGKRSPQAAVRIAVDLASEGLITGAEALARVSDEHITALTSTHGIGPNDGPVATGLGACPGVAVGRVARDLDEVTDLVSAGHEVILARSFTAPEDVPAMFQSVGVVTEVGGATSHAALVCREIGLPCVVGAGDGLVGTLAGEVVTVDGTTGNVYLGNVMQASISVDDPHVRRLIEFAHADGAAEHPVHRLARAGA